MLNVSVTTCICGKALTKCMLFMSFNSHKQAPGTSGPSGTKLRLTQTKPQLIPLHLFCFCFVCLWLNKWAAVLPVGPVGRGFKGQMDEWRDKRKLWNNKRKLKYHVKLNIEILKHNKTENIWNKMKTWEQEQTNKACMNNKISNYLVFVLTFIRVYIVVVGSDTITTLSEILKIFLCVPGFATNGNFILDQVCLTHFQRSQSKSSNTSQMVYNDS